MRSIGRSASRRLRHLTRPLRWSAFVALGWSHRHTVALWWRSLSGAVRERDVSSPGLATLVRALLRVTLDRRLENRPEIRSLRLRGDAVEVEGPIHGAARSAVTATLGAVTGVEVVRFAVADDPGAAWDWSAPAEAHVAPAPT